MGPGGPAQAEAGMPGNPRALWQQGQRHAELRQWEPAIACFRRLLAQDRGFLPAWMELARIHEAQDHYRDACAAVLEASRVDDAPPMAALVVARALRKFDELPRMQDYVERMRLPSRLPPEKLIDLASFFSSAGDHASAMGFTQRALAINPDLAEAQHMLGLLLMFEGRAESSAAALERTLAIKPGFASARSVLSRVRKATPQRHQVDELRRQLAQPGLAPKDEAHLAFALHNELHDLGEFDPAWDALVRGCRARQIEQPWDAAGTLAAIERWKATFDRDFVRGEPLDDPLTPIFIIGLHRTGTSLLERMLSGHPEVADAGETHVFTAQLCHATDHLCRQTSDEVLATRAATADFAGVGRGFLEAMRRRSKGKPFLTEKQNPNFMLAGAIARSLPHARILHMRRSPVDTCFSNLRTLFTNEAAYSYDQVHMADFYRTYRDLMAHWRDVMPERLFDVDYEDLVREPGEQARRVSAHCGFAYRDDMLRVDRDSGVVATASASQVRGGIVINRGGLWRPYEHHLGPLLDRLAAHGLV